MWTNREKELEDIKEIENYLTEMDNFHDYMLGGIEYSNEKQVAKIFVETEHKIENSAKEGLIWHFEFEQVTNFEINIDQLLASYISEITLENSKFVFELTNGNIYITASKVKLGIPSKE